ncbi:MAG: hypothetical protein LUQ31_01250 [Methanoregula sp.]|nr:hypothetical protein [Methanoregula sp.]
MKDNKTKTLYQNTENAHTESETSGAPQTRPKKHFGVYTAIISTLLKKASCTKSELADDCGYSPKGKDKIANIDRQVNELVSLGYVEGMDGPSKALLYQIKRNPDVIRRLYQDKKFSVIRPDFLASPWLTDILIQGFMQNYPDDPDFLEDARTMLHTSRFMFEFYLENDAGKTLNKNISKILGPSHPHLATAGINTSMLKSFEGKCQIYDLYLISMVLEHKGAPISKEFPDQTREIFEKILVKTAQNKLAVINYIATFTTLQNIARCIDSIKNYDNHIPEFITEIVEEYNQITSRLNSEKTDRDSLKNAEEEISRLYDQTLELLKKGSCVDSSTGQIKEMNKSSKAFISTYHYDKKQNSSLY